MILILCSLLVATLPFGSVLADAPSKNAKVTLVYQHELPNVPGKSIGGVLVEIRPRRVLAWSHASQIRVHLRDRA
jgi:quercetin dioxygenase-like cupin family protein